MEAVMLKAIEQLEGLELRDRDAWERAIMVLYLLMYHRRSEEEGGRLGSKLEEALEEQNEDRGVMQTLAGALLEKGERIGVEKGERIGIQKGARIAREMSREMLELKFGPLPESARQALLLMSLEQLEELSGRIRAATSLAELGL